VRECGLGQAERPRVALTLGDVAGIGPEVTALACVDCQVRRHCTPVVFGNAEVLRRAAELRRLELSVCSVESLAEAPEGADQILCVDPFGDAVLDVRPATVDARAGEAAYHYLRAAIDAALTGAVDAIVTAPLNKLALRRAGVPFPGHTEILAEACGVDQFAMLLYVPRGELVRGRSGLAVAHVTLHTGMAQVPGLLTLESVSETIDLVDGFLRKIRCRRRRIGVCAFNPHASESGLFGREEERVIGPAVERAQERGVHASGPIPADVLFRRAVSGEFDGVVAMYHDQGHIPLKLIAFDEAVNVTVGLPIIRTSPSHGTAFDIAWLGQASPRGMVQAVRVAVQLAQFERQRKQQLAGS